MQRIRVLSTAAFALALTSAAACLDGTTVTEQLGGDDAGCTLTQGYWKNHPEAWPVVALTLGDVTYDQDELLAIFDEPVASNGLIQLSHQLIAAKLNVANGAPDGEISDAIDDADALIGGLVVPPIGSGYLATSVTSELNDELAGFNEVGPEDCEPTPPACGDGTLDEGEECDDGNTSDGDGCSANCTDEPTPPACGDGTLDEGEECDDGNTSDGDGCSGNCTDEPTPPACGDGTLDEGEECDDGNGSDGDGCSSNCTIELPPSECGNGIVEPGEACDDGNTNDLDQCSNDCDINT